MTKVLLKYRISSVFMQILFVFQDFLMWVCERLFQALFPGASYPSNFIVLSLLGIIAELSDDAEGNFFSPHSFFVPCFAHKNCLHLLWCIRTHLSLLVLTTPFVYCSVFPLNCKPTCFFYFMCWCIVRDSFLSGDAPLNFKITFNANFAKWNPPTPLCPREPMLYHNIFCCRKSLNV